MVKIGRLTAAVGERLQRNSRQKRNFLHNLPRIQSLINPLGRKQRRTFSNIFSATYEQRQNKFPLKMVLMMLKHCMLYSILLIFLRWWNDEGIKKSQKLLNILSSILFCLASICKMLSPGSAVVPSADNWNPARQNLVTSGSKSDQDTGPCRERSRFPWFWNMHFSDF